MARNLCIDNDNLSVEIIARCATQTRFRLVLKTQADINEKIELHLQDLECANKRYNLVSNVPLCFRFQVTGRDLYFRGQSQNEFSVTQKAKCVHSHLEPCRTEGEKSWEFEVHHKSTFVMISDFYNEITQKQYKLVSVQQEFENKMDQFTEMLKDTFPTVDECYWLNKDITDDDDIFKNNRSLLNAREKMNLIHRLTTLIEKRGYQDVAGELSKLETRIQEKNELNVGSDNDEIGIVVESDGRNENRIIGWDDDGEEDLIG